MNAASQWTLDAVLKLCQILFYVIGASVAVLTYRSAKRGLLNTVNTEYQKRVMERLKELADELAAEFSPQSPSYWARQNTVRDAVRSINKHFAANRHRILSGGEFGQGGMHESEEMSRIAELLRRVKTDPFVPRVIREPVADLLERRFHAFIDIHMEELQNYRKVLASGKRCSAEELETNDGWVASRVLHRMYERGVGVSQVQDAVDQVRLAIQQHLESFNPLARRLGATRSASLQPRWSQLDGGPLNGSWSGWKVLLTGSRGCRSGHT